MVWCHGFNQLGFGKYKSDRRQDVHREGIGQSPSAVTGLGHPRLSTSDPPSAVLPAVATWGCLTCLMTAGKVGSVGLQTTSNSLVTGSLLAPGWYKPNRPSHRLAAAAENRPSQALSRPRTRAAIQVEHSHPVHGGLACCHQSKAMLYKSCVHSLGLLGLPPS